MTATARPLQRGASPSTLSVLPVAALALTGILIGATVPLSRLAGGLGVAPLTWALAASSVSAALLAVGSRLTCRGQARGPAPIAYYAAIGLFSIAAPNALLFAAIRELGAAAGSLAYTLPPLLTLALAGLVGLERITRRRVAGIALGLAGTLAIVLPRGTLPAGAPGHALVLLGLVPLSVAIGNVVRARYWRPGSPAIVNATGVTAAGVLWLVLGTLVGGGPGALVELGALASPALALLVLAQGIAAASSMLLFFWLQRVAGAVFTSQVGYVATGAGLGFAALVFGEHVSPWLGVAAGMVMLGVTLGRGDVANVAARSPRS